MKHVQCFQCKSFNTELEIDESIEEDGDESLSIQVWCLDCMTYSSFPDDENWREYD